MANFYKDNEDLRFYARSWIDWAQLVPLSEAEMRAEGSFESVEEACEFYEEILDMVGGFTAERIAPHAHALDTEEMTLVDGEVQVPPTMKAICDEIAELGLHGLCLPRELDGLNAPLCVYMANAEIFARADVGLMTHLSFHGGIAMALLVYSVHEGTTSFNDEGTRMLETRFADAIREIAAGEAWGSMDITEPNAGSDMAALRTRAVEGEDGTWRLTGSKIFITSGHAKYHIVIARTEDTAPEEGLKGLSLFLVPLYEDTPEGRRWHGSITRIEEKLGHHSSPTCQIEFEDTPGHLIGERGEGFRLMLLLMNNARVGVAFEGVGIAEAALRKARGYAAERTSMGKTIDRHEMIADYLDEMDIDVRAARALAFHGAFHEEMTQKLRIKLQYRTAEGSEEAATLERAIQHHAWESRRVTPLAKYFASEKAVEIAQRAIQIHGGVGYTVEYGVEKLLRDAMVLPIYEGTSQIQSLMAMKDQLGRTMKDPQGFAQAVAQTQWRALSARDPLERRVAKLQRLAGRAQLFLIAKTAGDKFQSVRHAPIQAWLGEFTKDWDPKRDFAVAMLHAERFMKVLCDATVAELFWEQAKAHPERRALVERWLERAEPRAKMHYEEITTRGRRLLRALDAQDAAERGAAE